MELKGIESLAKRREENDPLRFFDPLCEDSGREDIERALRQFSARLVDVDPIAKATAREAAIKKLKGIGCVSSAALVDAALPKARGQEENGTALNLSDPEPCPDEVDGAQLLEELAGTVRRFIALHEGAAETIALWAVFTHCHDSFYISPILTLSSPEKRCGKSTLLTLLGALVPRPMFVANMTVAVVFRAVDKFNPTLLIDEAETFIRDGEELRGVLNSGHLRSTAQALRIVGDDLEPRIFRTWGPKAVALIGKLPDTLRDRSISIPMRRRSPNEKVERQRLDRLAEFKPLCGKAARWALDNAESLKVADPPIPDSISSDRARDNWRPLLSIADLAGGEWPDRARHAAQLLEGEVQGEESARVLLLEDIRALFEQNETDRLSSDEIVNALTEMEERPWPEWKRGNPLTKRQLAGLLRPFGIVPTTIRTGGKTPKGYTLKQFGDAFERYLAQDSPGTPPPEAQHRHNIDGQRDTGVFGSATKGEMLRIGNLPKSNVGVDCVGVADQNPPLGGDPAFRCYACKCTSYYFTQDGTSKTCCRCHPPADSETVIHGE